MARVTLKDVAAAAGVSRATVSLVVNDSSRIPEATKGRVREAIDRLGYIYDRRAAHMRNRQASTVALVATDIRNPFFAELAMAVEEALDEAGIALLQTFSRDDLERQQRLLRVALEHRVSGILLVPAYRTSAASLARSLDHTVPHVLITRHVRGHEGAYVAVDNHRAGTLVAEHLLEVGARRVAFIGGPAGSTARTERERGLRARLRRGGVHLDRSLSLHSEVSREDGRAAVRQLLAMPAAADLDALVCYSDYVASGVVQALVEAGRRVGRDILVASFDDTSEARSQHPPLTSVNTYPALVGARAAQLLLDRIAHPDGAVQRVELSPSLEPRPSTTGAGLDHGGRSAPVAAVTAS
jgi:LacI family transcriptional regulator